jgi:hypothetical protein
MDLRGHARHSGDALIGRLAAQPAAAAQIAAIETSSSRG